MHYIGLDVHKKTIAYCAKTADGTIVDEGTIQALRPELEEWAAARPAPWKGTLEATLFSGWIYDTLEPHAEALARSPGVAGRGGFQFWNGFWGVLCGSRFEGAVFSVRNADNASAWAAESSPRFSRSSPWRI
jgi:hypothetical protein